MRWITASRDKLSRRPGGGSFGPEQPGAEQVERGAHRDGNAARREALGLPAKAERHGRIHSPSPPPNEYMRAAAAPRAARSRESLGSAFGRGFGDGFRSFFGVRR